MMVKELGLAMVMVAGACYAHQPEPPQYVEYRYEVSAGDTLWGIASMVTTDGEDIREVIWRIKQDNAIKNEPIQPGQELRIRMEAKR